MIRLYHYSDELIEDKLKVDYYGNNYYTANDCKTTTVKRIFFYTDKNYRELLLKSARYCYIVEVNEKDIYDITKDEKNYLKLYKGDIDLALRAIIRDRYKGVKYNLGYDVVNIFSDIEILQKRK